MSAPTIFALTVQPGEAEGEHRLVAEWRREGELTTRRTQQIRIDQPGLLAIGDPAEYGETLGRMLFVDGIRELFAQARADPAGLRVLLAVEVSALQSLRWERLAAPFDNDRWRMLGQNQRTPLSFHLPSGSDHRFPSFERDELRALVVVASPEDDNRFRVDPFDEEAALDTVLEGLGEIPSTILGKSERAAGLPSLEEICRRLTDERYTLLHIVAHGAVSKRAQGDTAVYLLGDEDGLAEVVPASKLIQRLEELDAFRGLPHLAFLSVCESAKPQAEGAFGGLGQRLVRELGMPAVVAMTDRVRQDTALTLSRGFYERLREHGEVDRALVEACVDVRRNDDVVVPALFSRIAGRPLFTEEEKPAAAPAPVAEPAAAPVPVPAPAPSNPWPARLGIGVGVIAVGVVAFVLMSDKDPPATTAANDSAGAAASAGQTKADPTAPPTTGPEAAKSTADAPSSESTAGPTPAASTTGDEPGGSGETTAAPTPKPTPRTTPRKSPTTSKCDSKTKRAIAQALRGKSCGQVKAVVKNGKLTIKDAGIKNEPMPSSVQANCTGTIQCPD